MLERIDTSSTRYSSLSFFTFSSSVQLLFTQRRATCQPLIPSRFSPIRALHFPDPIPVWPAPVSMKYRVEYHAQLGMRRWCRSSLELRIPRVVPVFIGYVFQTMLADYSTASNPNLPQPRSRDKGHAHRIRVVRGPFGLHRGGQ